MTPFTSRCDFRHRAPLEDSRVRGDLLPLGSSREKRGKELVVTQAPRVEPPSTSTVVGWLAASSGGDSTGRRIPRKSGSFALQRGLSGLKRGRNQGFAVTDSLTLPKCNLLIPCLLRVMKGPKKDFHRVGGGGQGVLGEKKRERQGLGTRDQGLGTRIARAGDWAVVIWASRLRLFLLSAWGEKLSARTFGLRSRQAPQRGQRTALPTVMSGPPARIDGWRGDKPAEK